MEKWNTFERRIVIINSIEAVYRSWATKGEVESWFLEKADYASVNKQRRTDEPVQKNDTFVWKWHNWDFSEPGQILEANGKDFISFTFGSGGIVSVKLKDLKGGTEVTLVQGDIPTDEKSQMDIFVGCITGWTFWLKNLKAYLEHNITLHATGLQQADTTNLVNC